MSGLRILIVDDDEDFADGLMEVFELEGHLPAMALTGQEGVDAVDSAEFDVALVDIGLPDMSGADCLDAIRKRRPELACFLLTGYSAEEIARRGIETGIAEILTKPVDPNALCRRLAEL